MSISKETIKKISDARETFCSFCEADICESCQGNLLETQAYVEAGIDQEDEE